MTAASIAAVDTRVPCPSCEAAWGVRASLWYARPRTKDGRIVGYDGQCALCNHTMALPVEMVPVARFQGSPLAAC